MFQTIINLKQLLPVWKTWILNDMTHPKHNVKQAKNTLNYIPVTRNFMILIPQLLGELHHNNFDGLNTRQETYAAKQSLGRPRWTWEYKIK
jgi:hypothetical protein